MVGRPEILSRHQGVWQACTQGRGAAHVNAAEQLQGMGAGSNGRLRGQVPELNCRLVGTHQAQPVPAVPVSPFSTSHPLSTVSFTIFWGNLNSAAQVPDRR